MSFISLGTTTTPGRNFWEANKYYGGCANGESDIKWHLILHPFISSLGNFRSDWDNEVPFYLCFSGLRQLAVFLSSESSGTSKTGKTVDIRFFHVLMYKEWFSVNFFRHCCKFLILWLFQCFNKAPTFHNFLNFWLGTVSKNSSTWLKSHAFKSVKVAKFKSDSLES